MHDWNCSNIISIFSDYFTHFFCRPECQQEWAQLDYRVTSSTKYCRDRLTILKTWSVLVSYWNTIPSFDVLMTVVEIAVYYVGPTLPPIGVPLPKLSIYTCHGAWLDNNCLITQCSPPVLWANSVTWFLLLICQGSKLWVRLDRVHTALTPVKPHLHYIFNPNANAKIS